MSMKKKILYSILVVLGFLELWYGMLWGRMKVMAHEAGMWHDLGLSAEKQGTIFSHYIGEFKDHWHIVGLFGVITILVALGLILITLKENKSQARADKNCT
jgi:hypothetical protein